MPTANKTLRYDYDHCEDSSRSLLVNDKSLAQIDSKTLDEYHTNVRNGHNYRYIDEVKELKQQDKEYANCLGYESPGLKVVPRIVEKDNPGPVTYK